MAFQRNQPRPDDRASRWLIGAAAAIGLALSIAPAAPAQPDVRPLDTRRWSERMYGLSLMPPVDTKVLLRPGGEQFARIVDDERAFEIAISVKHAARPVTVKEMMDATRLRIVDENTTSLVLDELPGEFGELSGFVGFYRVPMTGVGDVLVGLAILQADPQHFVVLELRGKYKRYKQQRPMYLAMLNTLKIADQRELAARRRAAVERTLAWRKQTPAARFMTAVAGERYYRIVEAGRDVGWMQVRQAHGEFNAAMGIKVTVKTHLQTPGGRLDAVADYFRPDDDAAAGEAWSVRSSLRNMPKQPADATRTVVETGAVTRARISVVIDGSAGVASKRLNFTRPSTGYLPQAETWLLHRVLPRKTPAEYGFYCYNNTAQQITFRTERVTPTLDGFAVHTRPSPNEPEIISRYDALGELVEKDLGAGRKLLRTNAAQLKALWRLR